MSAVEAWRHEAQTPSLPEVFRSIPVPQGSFWRRLLAFIGPGYLVAVGYMDPGNWATDISGGALYNYKLLSVVLISNFMAIFLQGLAAKLGLVTGRDLAQACRDAYPRPVAIGLCVISELGIVACDVAEVIGAAIALNLLFHWPLLLGVSVTALDVLLVLALQGKGFRRIEALVISLIAAMMAIFVVELVMCNPDWTQVMLGFIPSRVIITDPQALYISLGILGATVMPHNLYLHSSIVQTRRHDKADMKATLRFAYIDTVVALTLALFVNAAIVILSAAAFFRSGHHEVGDIQTAYQMLNPLLGATLAAPLFAVALLASGQNSTLTGTMAGQIVLEGFTRMKLAPWMTRMISRGLAILPALGVVYYYGDSGTGKLLLFSQVVLSMCLSFAVIPLVHLTGDAQKLGAHVNGPITKAVGWAMAFVVAGLNAYLVLTI